MAMSVALLDQVIFGIVTRTNRPLKTISTVTCSIILENPGPLIPVKPGYLKQIPRFAVLV